MSFEQRYFCGSCNEKYDTEDEARECYLECTEEEACHEFYVCPICHEDEAHEDEDGVVDCIVEHIREGELGMWAMTTDEAMQMLLDEGYSLESIFKMVADR